MNKEKLLILVVIVLVVLNVSVLGYLFFSKSSFPPPPPKSPERFIVELGFDEDQRNKFEILREKQFELFDEIDKKFNNVSKEYFELIKKDSFDPAVKDSLERVIAEIQVEKAKMLFNHFKDLKNICRPDQKEKFDELIPELIRFLKPPPDKMRKPH